MGRIRTKSAGIGTVLSEINRELGSKERTVNEREEHIKQQTKAFDDPVMRALIADILKQ